MEMERRRMSDDSRAEGEARKKKNNLNLLRPLAFHPANSKWTLVMRQGRREIVEFRARRRRGSQSFTRCRENKTKIQHREKMK
jgi:hypothetical protein